MEHITKSTKPLYPFWLYSILIFSFSLLMVSLCAEILVRVLIPKEFYLPINNIYQTTDTAIRYTYRHNFDGTAFGAPLKTNSLGFRGPEWQIEKEENTVRIALIGDSHAFGYGVPFEDTVGEKLAGLLNSQVGKKFEVLNFGVGGYNSRQELAILHDYALKFKPDTIIILPCNNDSDEAFSADKDGFLRTSTNIDVQDNSIAQLRITTASWFIKNSRLVYYLLFLKKQFEFNSKIPKDMQPNDSNNATDTARWMGPFPPGPIPDQLLETVYAPIKSMIDGAKKRQIPIIIANFNSLPVYRRLFAKLSQDEAVSSIELLALFPEVNSWQELQKQFGLGWDSHLNSVAHQRWALAIYTLLKEKKLYRTLLNDQDKGQPYNTDK